MTIWGTTPPPVRETHTGLKPLYQKAKTLWNIWRWVEAYSHTIPDDIEDLTPFG